MTEVYIDCGEIYLREFRIEDVDTIYEITSQPEVYEFLPSWKTTREQRLNYVENYEIPSNNRFLAALPDIEDQTYLNLAIILKETGKLIGFCHSGLKQELPAPNREIAYGLSKFYWNRGYASMAAKGLIDFLFEETNVEVLNAVALPNNVGSNRVIRKCGFQFMDDVEIDDQIHHHYILNRKDWRKHK
ncbi:GNAT family N-acetyltransferase [Bacillus sp. FJAT-29814]|uniref:GNAT family N-acetyltransferase n=1 Tax=Bacillus sp. FJAT-29814 TaxID=1729688 RepID=UPI00082AD577|nr:GNAT family N-acetyltransferase [Bacillus sp. FJAT-29814]